MRYVFVGVALVLAGCASGEDPAPPPVRALPPIAVAPHPDIPGLPQCEADRYQNLVGRSRYEIPVPVYPALQRVACTSCAVTMDYSPRRLNFFYDAETGLIKEVKCG